MSTVIVQYPSGPKFDVQYYVDKHMPLVMDKWGSHGMKGYKVAQITDPDSPQQIQCILFWESHEKYEAALKLPVVKEILGDISNFTEAKPVFMKAQAVGES